jgi:predicted GNAT superfamily acetyltransferase
VVLREVEPADLPAVTAMNNDAVPAVPMMDEDEMALLTTLATLCIVAVDEAEPDRPLGFVVAMDPGLDYASENYRWFAKRGGDFLYVDRIVIDEETRGAGVGRLLYGAVFAQAEADGRTEVACEVNLRPPNPRSLGFHGALGFERVGEQETKGGQYRVALLTAKVAADDA